MCLSPGNRVGRDIFIVLGIVNGDKIVEGEPKVIDSKDIHTIDSTHTHQAAVTIIIVFAKIELEDCRNFCDLRDWVLELANDDLGEFTAQGGKQTFLNSMHIEIPALGCQDDDSLETFRYIQDF